MKRQIYYIIALVLGTLAATLTSCEVEQKEPIYGPDGNVLQNPGRVHIKQAPEDVIAGQKLVIVDQQGAAVTFIGNNEWVDLEAGTYSLAGYTNPELFDLVGTTLSLKAATRGTIPALPDDIRGGANSFNVIEDNTAEAATPFKPLTRKLRIEGELDGINPANITSMLATLTGLAGGIDLSKGFGATVTSATGNSAQITVTVVDGKLVMEINLLGINPAEDQVFTLVLTTADGQTYTVTLSLKDVLTTFNTGSSVITFTISIRISVDSKSSVSGTIIDWEDGEEVEIPGV